MSDLFWIISMGNFFGRTLYGRFVWLVSIFPSTIPPEVATLLIQSILLFILILILAIGLTALFLFLFWFVCNLVPYIGIYKKLNSESPLGESFLHKISFYFLLNTGLSIFLVMVMFYFLYSSGTTPNATEIVSNITSTGYQPSNVAPSDIVYILSLSIVPGYLLAMRILANPTKDFFDFLFFSGYCITPEAKKSFIKDFKNMIVSFNIALIIGAVLYLSFNFLAAAANNKLSEEYRKYYSHFDLASICILTFIYLLVLLITTIVGEIYLSKNPPIERE